MKDGIAPVVNKNINDIPRVSMKESFHATDHSRSDGNTAKSAYNSNIEKKERRQRMRQGTSYQSSSGNSGLAQNPSLLVLNKKTPGGNGLIGLGELGKDKPAWQD